PEWAEVTSLELEPDPDTPTPGFKRFVGPALSADRTLSVRLNSGQGQAGAADSLFTQPNQDQPAPEAPGHRKRPFLPLPILLGVAFVLLLLVMRRRRT
ncbi:MAG TPA: hypothetical protein PLQ13_14865, partial [Candidatus Krumholzibacteria bacterium]|nr:hypothetical protein [Candidatus Krumholzibacteria bacterium]